MSDVKIMFSVGGKLVGTITSSLEAVDASPLLIPKRILNKITNTRSSVELLISVEHGEITLLEETPNE